MAHHKHRHSSSKDSSEHKHRHSSERRSKHKHKHKHKHRHSSKHHKLHSSKHRSKHRHSSSGHQLLATGPVTADSSRLLVLMKKLRTLMGEPEQLRVELGRAAEISAEYAGGNRIVLRDSEAISEPGSNRLAFLIPYVVFESALRARGLITFMIQNNLLQLNCTSYTAELNIERARKLREVTPLKGADSEPLKKMLTEAGRLLQLRGMVDASALDVHFKWGDGVVIGAAADSFHAVIVTAKLKTKKSHQVTMPMALASKLAEIGGRFDLGENRVQAESELGRAEISQVGETTTQVPLENIKGLLNRPSEWSAEVNSVDLLTLLSNLTAVVEGSQSVTVAVDKKTLRAEARGRFGKVGGVVDLKTLRGRPPKTLTFNKTVFDSILSKLSGNVILSKSQNALRLEPAQQDDWEFIGFAFLISDVD